MRSSPKNSNTIQRRILNGNSFKKREVIRRMTPVSVFLVLLILMGVMIIMSFILRNHDYYADVLFSIGSAILGWYLSLSLYVGNFGDESRELISNVVNETTGITTNVYETISSPLINISLAYLLSGIAIVMSIYAGFLILGIGLSLVQEVD